ncbi:MAG: hypothetical protein GX458_10685, partial [Phyllobacteriaceae bacterium]|nr:hypothetical protein [Phyllobacteriaceae bacterium]
TGIGAVLDVDLDAIVANWRLLSARAGGVPAAAEAELLRQPWPGNVRQLENVIFRAVTLSDQPVLEPADLVQAGRAAEVGAKIVETEIVDWDGAIRDFEKALLARLFPQFPSSRKLAARLSTSHTTIADRLRRYGLSKS